MVTIIVHLQFWIALIVGGGYVLRLMVELLSAPFRLSRARIHPYVRIAVINFRLA